jgi:tRNA(His) guanylyltransferase
LEIDLSDSKDTLGDYMKSFEQAETGHRIEKGYPMLARLDGRSFHTFTRGLDRPFDKNLTALMQETTRYLVKETNALIGYTQSDEITLIWYVGADDPQQYMFDGKCKKNCSVLSSMATCFFVKNLSKYLPSKADEFPTFDARVWKVPTLHDAFLALMWRENDAIKNSITMLALSHFSHKSLQGVNGQDKRKMLKEINDPWELYPSENRKGSYFARVTEERFLTNEELQSIPELFRPTEKVKRTSVKQVYFEDMRILNLMTDEDKINLVFQNLRNGSK